MSLSLSSAPWRALFAIRQRSRRSAWHAALRGLTEPALAGIDDHGLPLRAGQSVDFMADGPSRFWLFTRQALAFIRLGSTSRARADASARLRQHRGRFVGIGSSPCPGPGLGLGGLGSRIGIGRIHGSGRFALQGDMVAARRSGGRTARRAAVALALGHQPACHQVFVPAGEVFRRQREPPGGPPQRERVGCAAGRRAAQAEGRGHGRRQRGGWRRGVVMPWGGRSCVGRPVDDIMVLLRCVLPASWWSTIRSARAALPACVPMA
jgi:hypothetical protein